MTLEEENVEPDSRTQNKVSADTSPNKASIAIKDDEPVLSPQQQTILEKILDGENYFFTGSAGTGKSVLLRAIIKAFKDRKIAEDKTSNGTAERKWEDYLNLGRTGPAPSVPTRRWNLGVTASTGMAGV